ERERGQSRQEQEEAAELGVDSSRAEVELPDVGNIGPSGARGRGTVLVIAARQASKAFGLEDLVHGHRADGVAIGAKDVTDVVDGEVLLAQGDHAVTQGA